MNIRKNGRRGFTLIELVVVILILAILAALIIPRVVGRTDDAKRSKAASDIATLRSQVQLFKSDVGDYPQSLMDLRTRPSEGADGWRGPYLDKELPTDPWGNEYDYQVSSSGDEFTIISYGQDGAPGGDGNNADIGEEITENE
ncbi:MAG TPA: type II secretion system major pseudopilin GspG [Fimbriimonadaceae bacterium]|nr:type II secretion system major pseudopilin GspG [Fimbriimonadaceae bacterium]